MTIQFLDIAAAVLFVLGACAFIIKDEKDDRQKMRDLSEAFADGADAFWFNLSLRTLDTKALPPDANVYGLYVRHNPYLTSRSQHEADRHTQWERGYNQARQIHDKQLSNRDAINF